MELRAVLPPQEHVCHLFAGSAALAAQLLLAATVVFSLLYKRCGLFMMMHL